MLQRCSLAQHRGGGDVVLGGTSSPSIFRFPQNVFKSKAVQICLNSPRVFMFFISYFSTCCLWNVLRATTAKSRIRLERALDTVFPPTPGGGVHFPSLPRHQRSHTPTLNSSTSSDFRKNVFSYTFFFQRKTTAQPPRRHTLKKTTLHVSRGNRNALSVMTPVITHVFSGKEQSHLVE